MKDKIKVAPFNELPVEVREILTYYIELHRMRGMEQVRHLLKDDIGQNQKKKILKWEQAIADSLDREYEVIHLEG